MRGRFPTVQGPPGPAPAEAAPPPPSRPPLCAGSFPERELGAFSHTRPALWCQRQWPVPSGKTLTNRTETYCTLFESTDGERRWEGLALWPWRNQPGIRVTLSRWRQDMVTRVPPSSAGVTASGLRGAKVRRLTARGAGRGGGASCRTERGAEEAAGSAAGAAADRERSGVKGQENFPGA